MGSKKKQTVGHRWSWGQHLVLNHGPVDWIHRIWFGEKVGSDTKVTANSRITINKPELFGDRDQYGGVIGDIDVCLGQANQGINDYLADHCSKTIGGRRVVSAFRHLTALVFRKPEMGNSSHPPAVAVEVGRFTTGWDGNEIWYSPKADIEGNGMNAAHIVHELVECPEWGSGISRIDNVGFRQCADKLYAEKFGLSAHWTKQQPVEQFIKDICRYVNGYVFTDEATGKVTMRLARDDYEPATVPKLTVKQIKSVKNVRRRSPADLINTLTVNYTDTKTYEKASLTVINAALLEATGRVVGESIDFPMILDAKLAYQVAMRELRMLSARLTTSEIYCDTSASIYQPGDVVRVVYPPAGLDHIVRIQKKRRGSFANPEVRLDVMEDIFSAAIGDYKPPSPSNWVSPINEPQPITTQTAMELPYWMLANTLNPSQLAALNEHSAFVGWFAGKPTSDSLGSDLYYNHFNRWQYSHRASFASHSLLLKAVSKADKQIEVAESSLVGQELPVVAMLGNELVVINSLNGNVATLKRGVLDTIPMAHTAMTLLTVLEGDGLENEFTSGEQLSLRGLTVTPRGTLDESKATMAKVSFVGRAHKPLCVVNVQLNASYWPDSATLPLAVTLSHRNRKSQVTEAEFLTDWFTNGTPESNTQTHIKLEDVNAGQILYESTSNKTSYSFDNTVIKDNVNKVRVTLTAVRAGSEAMQSYAHEVDINRLPSV
ncbi:phage tail protein [Photobacterium sanguinicancri]|uniref:phage tail protein n=1 Tax=Photobacterium sanguinicancri TaxID=875932 RepID=UPI0026E32884|nr:phage tail protein [Photobacterium sanguinicancri]MDO6497316.1 phage tail protein [Photobacterium sanguinicancri]